MRIFLTGATGFMGRHLLKRLVQERHEVRCLSRSGSQADRLVGEGIQVAPGDVLEPDRRTGSVASSR